MKKQPAMNELEISHGFSRSLLSSEYQKRRVRKYVEYEQYKIFQAIQGSGNLALIIICFLPGVTYQLNLY